MLVQVGKAASSSSDGIDDVDQFVAPKVEAPSTMFVHTTFKISPEYGPPQFLNPVWELAKSIYEPRGAFRNRCTYTSGKCFGFGSIQNVVLLPSYVG